MENKLKDNLAIIIFIVLISLVGLFSANFALKNISPTQNNQQSIKKEEIEINKKTYDAIAKPSNYNSTISLESGFGRENPFAPYK
ncbi:MAG: hypothetical protein M1324_02380 [Patescibacteria group bacterium]|nr:hypothetical protein [Patescibacteria group bacterium]